MKELKAVQQGQRTAWDVVKEAFGADKHGYAKRRRDQRINAATSKK